MTFIRHPSIAQSPVQVPESTATNLFATADGNIKGDWTREKNMKTVQQHLRELDTDELLDRYFFDHPIEYRLPDFDGYTVAEIRRRNRDCMRRFIERLTGLEVRGEKNGRKGILFACRFMGDGFEPRTEDYCLVFTDEVLRNGADAKVYSYDLTEQEEIMGYLVADCAFTRRHLLGLMSDVLFEASFYGFEQEHLQEAVDGIREARKEAEEGRTVTLEELEERLRSEYGMGFDKEAPEERALRIEAQKAIAAYSLHCRRTELVHIAEDLGKRPV